ncbi:MAG: hypothetical protein ACPHM0_00285, partial [Flavobacteriales bacterium]
STINVGINYPNRVLYTGCLKPSLSFENQWFILHHPVQNWNVCREQDGNQSKIHVAYQQNQHPYYDVFIF